MRLHDDDDRATRDELIVSLRARGWLLRQKGRDRRVRLSAPTVQQILAANGVNGSVVHAAVWLDDDVSPEDAREAAIEAELARGSHSSCADAANRPSRRSRSSARSRGHRRRREPARNRSTPNRRRGIRRRERFRCPPTATLPSRLPPPTRPASPRQRRLRAHRADSACPRRSTRHARQREAIC